jgi:hypothetical protein
MYIKILHLQTSNYKEFNTSYTSTLDLQLMKVTVMGVRIGRLKSKSKNLILRFT